MSQKKYLRETIKLGDKDLIVETGKVAKQADGAVVAPISPIATGLAVPASSASGISVWPARQSATTCG